MDGNTRRALIQSDRIWDAVVIGAGPAGALAAHQLAKRGLKTLLVDGKAFPRSKVCGGCLSAKAVDLLERIGLGRLVERTTEGQTEGLQLHTPHRELLISVPGGKIVQRAAFDAALAAAAVAEGAVFLDNTRATVVPAVEQNCRTIELNSNDAVLDTVRTRLVLACDGLAGSSLARLPFLRSIPAKESRIGLGATVNGDHCLPPDRVHMAVHSVGYVGAVRLRDGTVHLAAAVDPSALKPVGPARLISNILTACRMRPPDDLNSSEVRGTVLMTRRPSRWSGERVFLLGDAAGYVEPFTGEGIARALASALAVVPLAVEAQSCWSPRLAAKWNQAYRRRVIGNTFVCRLLSQLCRRPWLLDLSMQSFNAAPRMAAPLVHQLNKIPRTLEALC
jgi:flavin-dependent dehydrogenase